MTTITEAAETCVNRLEAFHSYQAAVSAYREEFDCLARRFVTRIDAQKQSRNRQAEITSSAMKDVLNHWNVSTPETGSMDDGLWHRKQKLEQDVQRAGSSLEGALRAHLNTLPMETDRLTEMDTDLDKDVNTFEQDVQKLREAMDRVDLTSIEGDETQARFMARWAGDG
jgi:chromosome segregation ATPase